MAWIYLVASEGSVLPYRDGLPLSHTVRTTSTLNLSYFRECQAVNLILRPYGTMSLPCNLPISQEMLISSMEASPAKTSVLPALVWAWQEAEAVFFSKSCAWPKPSSPRSYSLKMSPPSPHADVALLCNRWPRSGTMLDGVLYPLQRSGPNSKDIVGLRWLRPVARDYKGYTKRAGESICNRLHLLYPGTSAKPSLTFLEKVMGYPLGWSELNASGTQWCPPKSKKRLAS